MNLFRKKSFPSPVAFTLVELLVVVSVLSLIGVYSLTIFTRTLKGNNKAKVISAMKQNGQMVLDQMTAAIRNADSVVCISDDTGHLHKTLVIVKDGKYTRFRFVDDPQNPDMIVPLYSIGQDNPLQPGGQDAVNFINVSPVNPATTPVPAICYDPLGTDTVGGQGQVSITDTDLKTGVRVTGGTFTKPISSGFKSSITITFNLTPGSQAPDALTGSIDPITFQTTVQLR